MSWQYLDPENWNEQVEDLAEALSDPKIGAAITKFDLLMFSDEEDRAAIFSGNLTIEGDFTPPARSTVIVGDLDVRGQISLVGVDGGDGNATLVVFGTVTCDSVQNDWASLLLISGSLSARSFVFTAREDSGMLVGGDFTTPMFVGYDIWVEVGGTASMEAGIGYAAPLSETGLERIKPNELVYPKLGEDQTLAMLGVGEAGFEAESILDQRLYETGSLLPGATR